VTAKSDFTNEEWIRVRRAPFVAGMAISLADPGGPIEVTKESVATIKSAAEPRAAARGDRAGHPVHDPGKAKSPS
jgi:hypothetical protein